MVFRQSFAFAFLFVSILSTHVLGKDVLIPENEAKIVLEGEADSSALGEATNDVKSASIHVYATTYAKGLRSIYLGDDENECIEIKLSNANVIGPYQASLEADSQLVFRGKEVDKDGIASYPPVAKVQLPGNVKEPVIVLVAADGELPYKALVLDRSFESFPLGSYLLLNTSPADIRGHVGDSEVVVSPSNFTGIKPSIVGDGGLSVRFEYQRSSKWKTFARTQWSYEPGKRTLLVAYSDPRTKRIKIRGVSIK